MENFIACLGCGQAIPYMGEFAKTNQAPEFFLDEKGEVIEVPGDDFKEFTAFHAGHKLDKLVVLNGPWSRQFFNEPVKEEFFTVVTEKEGKIFILKRWRTNINEPRKYQLSPGRIKFWVDKIEPQLEEIEKQLKSERPCLGSQDNEWKVQLFLSAIENILADEERFIKEVLEMTFQSLEDSGTIIGSNHPLIFFAKLTDPFIESLEYASRCFFNGEDRVFMENFIDRENRPDGVLALKVTFDFSPSH
jgi:hypothetical protein